ncbi:MAG: serine hydrolase, partial [Prevotella pallens]|nr:serine hydrolase [Prevotella pallens]
MASKTYNVLFIVAMLLLSSCSVFRGLALDGPSGPDIYEYQKLERDTIFKGDNPFC